MKSISIILASERRTLKPESWAPAYWLVFGNEDFEQPRQKVYASDANLTFPSKQEANRQAEQMAGQWCAENHPGCPVTLSH